MTASHHRRGSTLRGFVLALLACLPVSSAALADDAEIAQRLKDKGVNVTESNGVVTAVAVTDGGKMTDEDFGQLGRLAHLKTLSLNNCLNNERLALLADLGEVENLQTNLAQLTDDGVKPLARLKSLRNLKFFHPGPSFSGASLAHLADLPRLEQLTVAGSIAFNDEGMAAVAKLTRLREFRCWHAGVTHEGVRKLKALHGLKSLTLGQRLTSKPPACPTDETLPILAELQSLETLQLSESRLTPAALKPLNQLPALKRLVLEGIDIPKADVERLQGEWPKVKIEWTPPSEKYLRRIRSLFGAE